MKELVNVPQSKKELFLKTLGYKSALKKKIKFHLNNNIWNTELIICDKSKLVELLEVREVQSLTGINPLINFNM